MAEFLEESGGLESTTIGIYRTSSTVKGGRRFSFGALVVVGDRNGRVGLGYAKAPGVPAAIEKAQKDAKKNLHRVILQEGTVPHAVTGRFLASTVKIVPASAGTGVIAGGTVRAVLEMAGLHDVLTKATGSTNQRNLAKAVMEGLLQLRTKATIEELRGVKLGTSRVEEVIEAGRRYVTAVKTDPNKPRGPQGKKAEKGKGRGGKQGGGRGRGRGRDEAPADGAGAGEAPAAE
ncbi:MAG: 30S ribosomal protein S5 [Planctomycetes bacterium]|nr:30S ribosomal protein S5 [Planctomycetota bacterium]